MQEIQKQTYSKLITSKTFASDAFYAKSITLDFMYQFDNACIAMLSLTDILCEDNCIGKIGVKCIYGIVLAVNEYFRYTQKVIMTRFLDVLLDGVIYKITDISLDDHDDCMVNIMEFITQNKDFHLLYPYFEIIRPLKFSDLENKKIKKVYDSYCQNLRKVCDRLMNQNEKLFFYKLNGIKNLYKPFRNDERLSDFMQIIDQYSKEITSRVYILSNDSSRTTGFEERLRKDFNESISSLEIGEIDKVVNEKCKVILILDFEQGIKNEMLYYLGKLEGMLSTRKSFLAIFYGCSTETVKNNHAISELINRYLKGDDEDIAYKKTVKFIEKY